MSTTSSQTRTCQPQSTTMAEQVKLQYCRGCHTEAEEHRFDGFKQCNMCREKGLTRTRRQVTCSCGRTLLACSLKLHLRSLYHAEHTRPQGQQHPLVQRLPPLQQQQQHQAKHQQLPPQQLPVQQQPPLVQQLPLIQPGPPVQHLLPAQRQPPLKKLLEPAPRYTAKMKHPQQGGVKQPSQTPPATAIAPVSTLKTASALLPTSQAHPVIKPAQR
jgi:hypothetical protein